MKIFAVAAACGLFFGALAADATTWRRETVIAGIPGGPKDVAPHGLTGLSFGPDGALYVASFVGPGIFRFDLGAGTFRLEVGGLEAAADDVAVAGDGTLAWTGLGDGKLWLRTPGDAPRALASGLPLINPVAFNGDKILTGQIGQSDTLLEVDPANGEVKVLARDLGGINAFQPDGRGGLWVPLAAKGAVGRVDLETGTLSIVAEGLGQPVAVKADSTGALYAIDWQTGHVVHINPLSGETQKIATVAPPLDNLAIGPDDTIYVTRPLDNAIIAVDPVSGDQRAVVQGVLSAPGGLVVTGAGDRRSLIVADAYGTRTVDLGTGRVAMPPFDLTVNAGSMVAINDQVLALSYVRRGTVTLIDRASGRARHALGGFKAPMGLVLEADDTAVVADYGTGELIRVRPGRDPERATVIGGLQGPVGLAMTAAGGWIVSEADVGRVVAFETETSGRRILAERLVQPEGIAVMADGRIAVAEVGRRRLIAITPATGDIEVIAEDLPLGAIFTRAPAPVFMPSGVAAGDEGAVYLSCDGDNTVLKFTPEPAP